MIHEDSIPQEMRDKRQWVGWRYEDRDGKRTKVPYTQQGRHASTTDPSTWCSFGALLSVKGIHHFDGIGFVFNDDYTGVDLDRAVDDGKFKPWALEILKACPTYQEMSPSNCGAHLIVKGKLPGCGHKRKYEDGVVEIYSRGRFFTVTGNRIAGSPATIEDQSAFILALYQKLGRSNGNGTKPKSKSNGNGTFSGGPVDLSRRLEVALRDPVFSRLWHGDTSGNGGDDSAADLALCNKLCFYFGPDFSIVDSMFRQSGLMRDKWEKREDYREWTINKAIEGTRETYTPPRNRYGKGPGARPSEPINDPSEENSGETTDEPQPTKYSDDGIADLFATRHEHDFLYVDSWGWLRWTGQRWQRVSDVVVMGYARQVCRQQSELCKEDQDISPKVRAGLARALASAKVVAAVVRLAATDTRHYREASQFDKDLWFFNTPGGTINLRTGELCAHRREDLITKVAAATPQGGCPKWLAFLERITGGNKDLQNYVQRLAGYAMAGDPSEECLDFFYGEGGNGKGTFLKTLQHIFGEYSTTAQTETFLESKGEQHPTNIAKLAGARLVVAQEVDEGQHWNEVRLKTLTGRDEMTARFMRRDLFDFIPQFTLIISGNNKPALKTVDDAWRRRFHLVPFDVSIPKAEQNPDLKTELQAEGDGILNWCLTGCLDWQRQRLNPPEAVLLATAEYLECEDTFGMWIEECCLCGHDGYQERKALAFTSHRTWKQHRGERAPGMKTFSQRMQKHGFPVGQETSGDRARVFKGLRLTDDERQKARTLLEAQKMRERGTSPGEGDYFE